jgi:hypothetical protein
MTKKEKKAITEGLRLSRPNYGAHQYLHMQWQDTVKCLSLTLSEANPEFDKHEFLVDCGGYVVPLKEA